ncbi:hypothetical protein BJX64DRAFT_265578 [Aspergillus heterothallicus]
MHWVSGTWLWAKHRANRSISNPIYLEREPQTGTNPRTRANRPRTWSLPTYNPQAGTHRHPSVSGSATPSGPRSRSDSSVTSSSRGTQTHPGTGAGLRLHRTESYCSAAAAAAAGPPCLRCIRCGGYRSRTYHYLHFDDPMSYPERGICSRERTNCARVKAREQMAAEKEMEMRLGLEPEVEGDMGGVYELPDTSNESMETSSMC